MDETQHDITTIDRDQLESVSGGNVGFFAGAAALRRKTGSSAVRLAPRSATYYQNAFSVFGKITQIHNTYNTYNISSVPK